MKTCETSNVSPHIHNLRCQRCEMAKQVLKNMESEANKILEKKKSEYEAMPNEQTKEFVIVAEQENHDIKAAITHIEEFKRHQLRASRSERHRIELIEGLSERKAFVLIDWAQNMLPTYSRERQDQYFGKDKAAAWHITHTTTRLNDNNVHHTHVHIMEHDAKVIKFILIKNFKFKIY